VSKKHGKLITFLRTFMKSRPTKQKLKQRGILRERVFGCDLGEHLLNSGHDGELCPFWSYSNSRPCSRRCLTLVSLTLCVGGLESIANPPPLESPLDLPAWVAMPMDWLKGV